MRLKRSTGVSRLYGSLECLSNGQPMTRVHLLEVLAASTLKANLPALQQQWAALHDLCVIQAAGTMALVVASVPLTCCMRDQGNTPGKTHVIQR